MFYVVVSLVVCCMIIWICSILPAPEFIFTGLSARTCQPWDQMPKTAQFLRKRTPMKKLKLIFRNISVVKFDCFR